MTIDESVSRTIVSPGLRGGLDEALTTALRDVPFYRRLWAEQAGSVPRDVPPLEQWPTWNVAQLRDSIASNPPYGDLYVAGDLDDLAYVHSSTGTTGKPRIFPVPRTDLPRMEEVYREHMRLMGVQRTDICAITLTFGLPRGAWSCVQAVEAIGATVLPLSSGKVTPAEKLFDLLESVPVTVLQGAGSYLVYLTKRAVEFGFDTAGSAVRILWSNGEALSAEHRRYLESAWDAKVVMNFASTDLSWVSAECEASSAALGALGMHVTDGVVAEILDDELQPVAPGEYGELVVTSWLRRSTPRVRFRTGDRAAMTHDPCCCGSPTPRILPLQGRVDDAVRFHGQTIWAASVNDVLTVALGTPVDFYVEHRPDQARGSILSVTLPASVAAEVPEDLSDTLRNKLNVRFVVEFLEDAALTEKTGVGGNGKVRRIFDTTMGAN